VPTAERPPKYLTLSEVCDLIEVSSRQVQYLRETATVSPSVLGKGRGRPCLYSVRDIAYVWIAIVELAGLSYETKRTALQTPINESGCLQVHLSAHTTLTVNFLAVMEYITNRLS